MESKSPQELLKDGFTYLQTGELIKANETFSTALNKTISDKELLHSLYISRSSSNYLLGNDCNAFYDASKAIEIDPTQFEGYLRRSNVFLIYSFFDQAIQDMKKAIELNSDPTLSQDLNSRLAFMEQFKAKATKVNVPDRQNILSMSVPDNITLESAKEIGKCIFDDKTIQKESIQKIVSKLRETIEAEAAQFDQNGIGHITAPKITVLGRIDGNYGKLYAFFDKNGYPSKENVYLINGNFIGRENHKTLFILLLFKAAEPQSIFFTKGLFDTSGGLEHQSDKEKLVTTNYIASPLMCVESEFGAEVKNDIEKIISALPLCYIVNGKFAVTCCGPPITSISSLWGQFCSFTKKALKVDGFPIFCFGEDDVEQFLAEKGVEKLICSSKVCSDGYEAFMDGKLINVSFGKTDRRVFGYKLGCVRITEEAAEASVEKFDFFPLEVHYNENSPYFEGLFYSLRKYTMMNPGIAGFVRIKGVSEDFVPVTETIDTSIYMYSYMSVPVPGAWIIVDFGPRKVKIENYMIESAPLNKNNDHMKTWKILGSDDLQNWTQIDLRENVEELNGPLCHKVFEVDEDKRKFFRFVQILQHEKNHRGNWNLCLGHFDFFGTVQ